MYYLCFNLLKDHGDRVRKDASCCTLTPGSRLPLLPPQVALTPAEERAVAEKNRAEERQGTCLNLQRKSIAETGDPPSCDIPAPASQEAVLLLLYKNTCLVYEPPASADRNDTVN